MTFNGLTETDTNTATAYITRANNITYSNIRYKIITDVSRWTGLIHYLGILDDNGSNVGIGITVPTDKLQY